VPRTSGVGGVPHCYGQLIRQLIHLQLADEFSKARPGSNLGGSAVGFNVLTIRSGLDTGDDALYPALSDLSGPEIIVLDRQDGQHVTRLVATAVRVLEVREGGLKQLVRLREVKIDVFVTDSRVALACEKYDKGGGWVGFGPGGVLVAVTANAVSKARAASRRRGKVLVGHVRYPWLKSVGASTKSGFATSEAIRLEYSEKLPGGRVIKLVELTLPKNIDATLVAQEIARRAANYRLANYPDMKAEERAKFTSLSAAPPRPQPAPKKFDFVRMPTYYNANAATAFPRRAEPSEPSGFPSPALTGAGDAGDSAEPTADGTAGSFAAGTPVAASPAAAPLVAEVPPTDRMPANFCTSCGNPLVAGDRFCPACGVPVA
jgi:hypothetical protein